MTWWLNKDIRMIQNNLRDIDAQMDVKQYVSRLVEFGANACMVGCGGITSFYPTDLPFQTRSPYLKDDFFGRLIDECHAHGIRVIARFDFSKTNVRFLDEHPEWYSRTKEGQTIHYHDTVATCVNGEYQQTLSKEILTDAIERYPVDGVFFNMFGYQTWDYSNNYVGICQCKNCKSRFKEETGYILPLVEDLADPVFQEYISFKQRTVDELLEGISQHVRKLNEDIAVCTYNYKGVDLVRNESNTAIDRKRPEFPYISEHNSDIVRTTYLGQKASSNCAINAVDIFYRFMGVSTHQNSIRLIGDMATGQPLDWCIIGDFEDYPDTSNFDSVKEIFHFHKRYVDIFSKIKSVAKVLLLSPTTFGVHGDYANEYKGIYRMLKEMHFQFDVADVQHLDTVEEHLEQYELIVLPGIQNLSESFISRIQSSGIRVLSTAASLAQAPDVLRSLFSIEASDVCEDIRGSYFKVDTDDMFVKIKKSWIMVDKDFLSVTPLENAKALLPFIKTRRYGPPERCYDHEQTSVPGLVINDDLSAYFTWQLGQHYHDYGYEEFKLLFASVLNHFSIKPEVDIDVNPQVHVFFDKIEEGSYLLQLLNLSGFNGVTYFDPVKIPSIELAINGIDIKKVEHLTAEGPSILDGEDEFQLNSLDLYSAYRIYGEDTK